VPLAARNADFAVRLRELADGHIDRMMTDNRSDRPSLPYPRVAGQQITRRRPPYRAGARKRLLGGNQSGRGFENIGFFDAVGSAAHSPPEVSAWQAGLRQPSRRR
jgi:hypothetical protein